MTARLLDDKIRAASLRAEIRTRVVLLPYRHGLAVVLVGE